MRIASFNVENLFDRAKAFNEPSSVSNPVTSALAELNNLFEQDTYSAADKQRMLTLMSELGLANNDTGPFVILRRLRGKLVKRPRNAPPEIVADGRDDWVGWAELKTETINEVAIMNTGRVIRDVDADILAVVEAENRVVLKLFVDQVLTEVGGEPYEQVMVIDGNDQRGIDVGIMAKRGMCVDWMRTHIHDTAPDGTTIFSRDCPEYAVKTPGGETLWVLPNHFKSKFGGNSASSRAKRTMQSQRVAEIYRSLRDEGHENVIVLGDFNDTPEAEELTPLLTDTDLKDVSVFDGFDAPAIDPARHPGRGTFGLGNDRDKIDYLLLSPNLFGKVTKAGLFRKGAWPGKRPKRWEVYPELKREVHVASDHHVIWADIAI